MPFCFNCFNKIETLRLPCPHCGAPALYKNKVIEGEPDRDIKKKIEELPREELENYLNEEECERLFKRGFDCYTKGKAWLAQKDRQKARTELQRALKYFENILKIDPAHERARELRAKCVQKMP